MIKKDKKNRFKKADKCFTHFHQNDFFSHCRIKTPSVFTIGIKKHIYVVRHLIYERQSYRWSYLSVLVIMHPMHF